MGRSWPGKVYNMVYKFEGIRKGNSYGIFISDFCILKEQLSEFVLV